MRRTSEKRGVSRGGEKAEELSAVIPASAGVAAEIVCVTLSNENIGMPVCFATTRS